MHESIFSNLSEQLFTSRCMIQMYNPESSKFIIRFFDDYELILNTNRIKV